MIYRYASDFPIDDFVCHDFPLFYIDPHDICQWFSDVSKGYQAPNDLFFQEDEEMKVGRAWHSQLPRSLKQQKSWRCSGPKIPIIS